MSQIFLAFWLAAAGSSAVAADTNVVSQAISSDIKTALRSHQAVRTPVTSIIRLKRLPDGSLEQHCDVISDKNANRVSGQPRGQWVQTPEEQVR